LLKNRSKEKNNKYFKFNELTKNAKLIAIRNIALHHYTIGDMYQNNYISYNYIINLIKSCFEIMNNNENLQNIFSEVNLVIEEKRMSKITREEEKIKKYEETQELDKIEKHKSKLKAAYSKQKQFDEVLNWED
jgi:hypothetical protein